MAVSEKFKGAKRLGVCILAVCCAGCAGTGGMGTYDNPDPAATEMTSADTAAIDQSSGQLALDSAAMGASEQDTDAGFTSFEGAGMDQGMDSTNQASLGLGSSRVLLSREQSEIGLQFVDGQTINQIVIQPSAGVGQNTYKVTRLNNPPRLVVDLVGQGSRGNRAFDTSDSELVTKVRLGAHPDKSRIVLDLAEDQGISHQVDASEVDGRQSIVVTLAYKDAMRAAPKLDPINIEPQEPQSQPPAITAADADSEETLAPPPTREEAISAASEEAISSEAEKARLVALSIENLAPGENKLIAEMSAPGFFTFKRTAPSEYVLRFENASLQDETALPLISQPGSGAIRSVRPLAQGNDVLLRIFTLPANTLAAKVSGGKIVVSDKGGLEASEMKAQFAPEAAEAVAKSESPGEKAEVAASSAGAEQSDDASVVDAEVSSLLDEAPRWTGRLISLDLQDTDIDNALRIIAEVSNLNIIASEDVTGKVTLRLIDVPWDQALDVILKTNGLDKVQEGNVIRIAPVEKLRQEREALKQAQQAEEELEPLQVRYVRISYAKAAELKPLVESVISERGTVAYDERTNQLIIKDIRKGIKNIAELVAKVDLRTPQVLLETQIVEASRSLFRDVGSELGFSLIQSPETGNATGNNFPNSVNFGGSVDPNSDIASSFPAAVSSAAGSAVTLLLESADGTKSLAARLSALEREGRVRIISRPSVATTNNKQATIKSVEKIRIKTPSGGLSVATGSGATASGSSAVATEVVEIGITLEVTPQASPDYYVLLDINAKSSTFGDRTVDGIPSERERSATSAVLVSSGQTFAMGGIYKITDDDRLVGVPFFKDIPVIGHMFRTSRVDNGDEELLFFLTPRIIEGSFDDAAMKVSS